MDYNRLFFYFMGGLIRQIIITLMVKKTYRMHNPETLIYNKKNDTYTLAR